MVRHGVVVKMKTDFEEAKDRDGKRLRGRGVPVAAGEAEVAAEKSKEERRSMVCFP